MICEFFKSHEQAARALIVELEFLHPEDGAFIGAMVYDPYPLPWQILRLQSLLAQYNLPPLRLDRDESSAAEARDILKHRTFHPSDAAYLAEIAFARPQDEVTDRDRARLRSIARGFGRSSREDVTT